MWYIYAEKAWLSNRSTGAMVRNLRMAEPFESFWEADEEAKRHFRTYTILATPDSVFPYAEVPHVQKDQ